MNVDAMNRDGAAHGDTGSVLNEAGWPGRNAPRSAIALNGSFFHARRMLNHYVYNAYRSAADQ